MVNPLHGALLIGVLAMDAATARAVHPSPDAAPVDPPQRPQLDAGRIRDIVLARVATAGRVLTRAELARELWHIVSHLIALADWSAMLDRDLGALADAGLCEAKPVAVSVTEAGRKRAALVLGVDALPKTWNEARATRIVAKALAMDGQPARRLKILLKADGLRAAIVQHAFKLKVRGVPTPARIRSQLAKLALSRAFGNTLPAGLDGRSGLSAKAGRNLAGRLAHPPRDFATDSRLIAALATEHAGAQKADFESLQIALLRRYVTRGTFAPAAPPAKVARTRSKIAAVAPVKAIVPAPKTAPVDMIAAQAPTPPMPSPSAAAQKPARPDFKTFVERVRVLATAVAEGWPGNRKAFVSKVWGQVRASHPEWQVSEVEFKAMLAEAHRAGEIVLAHADLKDQRAIADIQASAIAYKNTIFHYVRVD